MTTGPRSTPWPGALPAPTLSSSAGSAATSRTSAAPPSGWPPTTSARVPPPTPCRWPSCSSADHARRRSGSRISRIMSPKTDLGRVITAMVTPFDHEGDLDLGRAEQLAAMLVANGNDGLVVGGTTGESPTLNHDEKLELYRAVGRAIPGAVVIMGAGSNDTRGSIELARDCQQLGADAVLAVVPYYNKPPQKSLAAHFKAIAAAVDIPVMLYNVPSRTVANLAAETTIELSHVSNIVALKEASADLVQFATAAAGVAPGFRMYSGDDSLTLPMLAVGGYGVVSVARHFARRGIRDMLDA